MSKYIFSLLLIFHSFWVQAQEMDDDTVVVKTFNSGHQLRIGYDLSKLLFNSLSTNKMSQEIALDYYWKSELYYVAELGFGNSDINYPDLKYKTNNSFVRLGMDKALFPRKVAQDWGLGFFGLRYGIAAVQRQTANYTTDDGLGGQTFGTIPSANFTAHWLELAGGMKIELVKGLFAGWTVRAKFLLNQKAFGDLKPAYLAGYGFGEKATAFDYNLYLAYGLRWGNK